MAVSDLTTAAVDQALAEFDSLGRREFLNTYGFRRATTYLLLRAGRLYDPKAITGVAHRFLAEARPLSPSELDATEAVAKVRELGYEVVDFSGLWWVNLGDSYRHERDGGFLWAPLTTKSGSTVAHHKAVADLRPGDLVICYADRHIRAIARVAEPPFEAARPAALSEDLWSNLGTLCPVDVMELDHAIPLSDLPERPAEAGPFDRDGKVKQGYLYRVSDDSTLTMLEFLHARIPTLFAPVFTHRHGDFRMNQGSSSELAQLVSEFRVDVNYPAGGRAEREQERGALDEVLSVESLEDPDVLSLRRLASQEYGFPGPQPGFHTLLQSAEGIETLTRTLRHLLYGHGDIVERLQDCLTGEYRIPKVAEGILVKALAVRYPDRWIPCYPTAGKVGKVAMLRKLHRPIPSGDGAVLAASTNDALRETLDPYFGGDPWGMQEFGWWVLHRERVPVENLDTLAAELYLPADFLERVSLLLEQRGQVVFYGPPGTGKTYVARKLAGHLARGGGAIEKIQFHASYAYEDFVEGYRPRTNESGQLSYEIVDGPIKRLADQARERPDVTHVMVIDELNRANVSRVLGEMLFLLEYREEAIRLQYSETPFDLPKNLKIIATMNTADRSIALVDTALRRRFHFVGFFPDQPPIDSVLASYLADHTPELMWLVDVVALANRMLGDRNSAIGPSHFMIPTLTVDQVELIWENSVIPFIEEQFFGDTERAKDYALERLRQVAVVSRNTSEFMAKHQDMTTAFPQGPDKVEDDF